MNVRIVLLGVAAAALIAAATACGGGGGGTGSPQITVPPGATGSQHVLGSPDAPLELIEYADFQ